jgi:hypothetical protein
MMAQLSTTNDQTTDIAGEGGAKYVVQSFVEGGDSTTPIPSGQPTSPLTPEREIIKHTLIGSPKAVMGTIHVLHQLGYAHVGDWSPLLPSPNPGEVMSILVRSIMVQ